MKKQLLTLQQLLFIMDPQLYSHLGLFLNIYGTFICADLGRLQKRLMASTCSSVSGKCGSLLDQIYNIDYADYTHSWILIAFKREFPFDDVLKLWEVGKTARSRDSFVI